MKKILFLGLILLFSVSFIYAQLGANGNIGNWGISDYSSAMGKDNFSQGKYSFAGGSNSKAEGDWSFAFGYMVGATANNAVIFGSHNEEVMAPFENNIPNSFMIGFNAWKLPSFFVEPFDNKLDHGWVGIHTITPRSTLDVAGTLTVDGFVFADHPQAGYVLKTDADGNASWQPEGVGSGGSGGSGTVTQVNTSTGLDGTITTSGTITVAFSEFLSETLVDPTEDHLIMLDNGAENKILFSNIPLSAFDDDIGAGGGLGTDGLWSKIPNTKDIYYGEPSVGFVGIGLNNPEESLHTKGSVLAEEGLKLRGDVNIIEFGGSAASKFHIVNGEYATLNYAFTIDANDKIGIGKNIPEEKLHVGGNIKVEQSVMAIGSVTADANMISKGFFLNDNTNSIHYFGKAGFPSTYSLIKKVGSSPGKSSEDVMILKVGADNNIGIGTTSLGAKLDVNGDVLIREGLEVKMDVLAQENIDVNGDATVMGDILTQGSLSLNNSNSTVLYGVSGVRSSFSLINIAGTIKSGETSAKGAYDVEVLTVDGYNKVGIGTSTPNAKLHVAGDVLVRDSLKVEGNLLVEENLDVKGDAQILGELNFTTGLNQISFGEISTPKTLKIRSNYTPEAKAAFRGLVISSIGEVGIGIDNPSESLEVRGTTKTEGFQMTGGNAGNGKILQSDGTGKAFWVDPETLSGVGVWTEGNDVAYYSGSVEIGTNDVGTHMLAVNGSINAKLIKVTLDVPGSDYVFESDYSLMPLNELESFVKTNKHLPEVMSAEEFAKDGYSLGEMDDVLLRKVEELTLYVIDQDKTINTQQEALEQQQILLEKQQKLIDQLLEAQK